jgi:acetylornithine deacetylase/succinyl-diaminopimelate desuccinylase-like protein
MSNLDAVTTYADAEFDNTVSLLCEYLAIPAISCDPAHFADVDRLAERIAKDLNALGLEGVDVLRLEGALPLVVADYRQAGPEKPTILIYGHLDLQPVKGEPWDTPPHEATIKGRRLYARGSADDMGGWVSHLAALKAYLSTEGSLPCNVRFVIEGEEEIGSPNLERYMDTYPERFEADAMVLTDCENPSTEIPGLTVSLRGLLEVEITAEALHSDVHSGLWGNMGPDVGTSLFKMVAKLVDDDGRFALLPQDVPSDWREAAWNVPLDDEVIRKGAHLIDEVEPLPTHERPPAEWIWRQPAVTILSTTFPRPENEKNALRSKASVTVSIRIAPGQTAEDILHVLKETLLSQPVGGVKLSLTKRPGGAESWLYTPKGPAFGAVDRAYEKAWGCKPLQIGVGGSIPFVAMFGKRFSTLPLILNGVMDPETGAHGPNESMDLHVFKKAIIANIYLLDELSRVDLSST